jgi:hypothetical protein
MSSARLLASPSDWANFNDRFASAESVSDGVLNTYSRSLRTYHSPQHSIWPVSRTSCKIRHMNFRSALPQLLIVFAVVGSSYAAELDQQALVAWENYIASVKVHMQERLTGKSPFLWVDEDPMRRHRLNSGEIVVSPVGNSHPLPVSHGLIHHWIGAVFIPGATIQDLSAVVGDYGRYSEIYRPTLIKAELLDSTGDEQKFSILWVQRVLLVTAAFYSELDSHDVALNSRQGYMTFSTTRVQQIENYGEKDERRLAPGEGSGYLWRLISFARFEERDGGLYLELEVIGLSKDLPGPLRLLLKPIIDHVPRQALTVKLDQTRQAIRSRASQRVSALLPTAR